MYARKCVNESLQVRLVSQDQIFTHLPDETRRNVKTDGNEKARLKSKALVLKIPERHPQFFTAIRVFKPRDVNTRTSTRTSRPYVSRACKLDATDCLRYN